MNDSRQPKLLPLRAAILATLLAAGAPALADDHATHDLEVTMDVVEGDDAAHETNDAHELVVHEEHGGEARHEEGRHEPGRHEPAEEHHDASRDGDHEDADHEDADDGHVDDNHDDVHDDGDDGEHHDGGDHEDPGAPREEPHTGEHHGPG